jgi:uncharacterized protein (DUF2141 family)
MDPNISVARLLKFSATRSRGSDGGTGVHELARSKRIVAMAFLVAVAGLLAARDAAAADLEVLVKGISKSEGKLQVALYQGKADQVAGRMFVATSVRAAEGDQRIVFADLPPERYAVAVFHDLDADGELNMTSIGVPIEPYGFSRDARGTRGPPVFEQMVLEIADEDLRIEIQLRDR